MFIAAEPWSKMIYLEKELDAFITENKENSELSDHVQSHMKVFMRQQEDSSDEDAGDIDDSDDDETWQPTPPPTQVSFVSPSPVSTPTAAHSRARKQSQGSLANKRPRTAGTHVEDRHQNSEASLALIASEEQRALPPELLPQVLQAHESAKAASANDPTNSKPLTLAEFQEGMDSLKRFIAHKLRKIRTSSSSLHQMVSADFLKEEFEGHDGRVCNFSDLPRTTTSKFIRAYASARYGVEYVQSHVFGEYKGTTQRPKAPGEVQDHLKSILNKAFNIPRDQTVSAWTAVKDSLNRLGPESTFRKRKAGD